MGIIFGKKKARSRVTEQDKAVLQLKQQRDKLKQYQKRIENTLAKDREIAKKLLQDGHKERAKLLLRKKRYQEQLLAKTDGQLENLERLTHDIEFAQIELQVADGLHHGNEALKKVNEALNIADIEKILEETREGIDKQEEINNLLSGALTEEDEEAVNEEFDELLEQVLPNVPSEELPVGEPILPEVPDESVEEMVKGKNRKEAIALEV